MSANKAYAFNPSTGESKVYDFDNPDNGMHRQMADVLINRLDNPAVLKLLYLDRPINLVPQTVRDIIQDLLDGKIDAVLAKERVLAWKASIPA